MTIIHHLISLIFNPPDLITNLTGLDKEAYNFTQTGTVWPGDKKRYAISDWSSKSSEEINFNLIPPPAWQIAFPELRNGYTSENLIDISKYARLQVWMRLSGLPKFKKMWGVNSVNGLAQGTWEISMTDSFNMSMYEGEKFIVISTLSKVGGKNYFLWIVFMGAGVGCIMMAFLFLIGYIIKPRFDYSYSIHFRFI